MGRTDALQRAHEMLDYAGLGEARYRLLSLLYQEAVLGHEVERLGE